ncbi:outer membrane protein assembly factor BamD [Flavobacteriaceae bacterium AU392]|nr:outer membrane protein assembly factor BamD [Flavobacteriaceae bacterium]RKM86107.1 outer membrane protein assembly factor BamD [Flavobacteriaceae bacterium AU392]
MKKLVYILLVIITFNSCSEYQKALKSEDIATRFNLGTELFDAGKYDKAQKLFEPIIPKYRGKPQAEKLNYLYALTFYEERDYAASAYHMRLFADVYPESEKAAELAFLSAKSYYNQSPIFSKEQEATTIAIGKLQEFINAYTDSEFTKEANELVKELDFKLEKKAFSIAKQYNTISDFQASIKSFDNFIFQYPGTSLKEEAMFLRLDSSYKLAINSIEIKKEERLDNAISNYKALKKSFAESKYMEKANVMFEELTKQSQIFKEQKVNSK